MTCIKIKNKHNNSKNEIIEAKPMRQKISKLKVLRQVGSKTSKPKNMIIEAKHISKPKNEIIKVKPISKKDVTKKSKQKISRQGGSKTSKPKNKDDHITNEIDINALFNIIKKKEPSKNEVKKPITFPKCDNTSINTIQSYVDKKDFLVDNNITISTITLDCKLHTLINVDVFSKHVVLKEDGIVSIKYGNRNDIATNRTIVELRKKKKVSTRNFYNQVTILMKPMNNIERNYINIKVFQNGSLQVTGCKDMDDFNNIAHTLINILSTGKDIKNSKGKLIRHVDYIVDHASIGLYDTKIRMINSNFKLNYKIDRMNLARLLRSQYGKYTKDTEIGYVEHKYEPNGKHACINIKYKYDEQKSPSIFVFQTGAIIITGAKNLQHIIASYAHINKILDKFMNMIRIIDLDPIAVQKEAMKYLKDKKAGRL